MRPDYGAPLHEVGFHVRKDKGEDGFRFGLFKGASEKSGKAASKPRTNGKAKAAPKGKAKQPTPQKEAGKAQKVKAAVKAETPAPAADPRPFRERNAV